MLPEYLPVGSKMCSMTSGVPIAGYLDLNKGAGGNPRMRRREVRVELRAAGGDDERTTLRHRIAGIDRDFQQRGSNWIRRSERAQHRPRPPLDGNVFAQRSTEQTSRPTDEAVDVDRLGLRRLVARKRQHERRHHTSS